MDLSNEFDWVGFYLGSEVKHEQRKRFDFGTCLDYFQVKLKKKYFNFRICKMDWF